MQCPRCLANYEEKGTRLVSSHQCGKPSVSNDLLDGWEITPSIDGQWDSYFIPIEKDPEGEEAKSKAIDVMEALWDDAGDLETMNITVTLKRTKIHKKDYDVEGSDI